MLPEGAYGGVVQGTADVELHILGGTLDARLTARHDEGLDEELLRGCCRRRRRRRRGRGARG